MPHDVCHWRNAYLFDNPLRRLFHNPHRMLGGYVADGMTVLDVGCGMGFFSIGMARMVGTNGHVHSADLQQEMLDVLKKRATRKGVADRIETHLCTDNNIDVAASVEFILAFWMVHEVSDQLTLLSQLRAIARPRCRLLIAEPKIHVKQSDLQETSRMAKTAGWIYEGTPEVRLSHAAVFSTE